MDVKGKVKVKVKVKSKLKAQAWPTLQHIGDIVKKERNVDFFLYDKFGHQKKIAKSSLRARRRSQLLLL